MVKKEKERRFNGVLLVKCVRYTYTSYVCLLKRAYLAPEQHIRASSAENKNNKKIEAKSEETAIEAT